MIVLLLRQIIPWLASSIMHRAMFLLAGRGKGLGTVRRRSMK